MKLELIQKDRLYEKTELMMAGTATYDNGTHERFTARAFVSMYGAIHIHLTVHHPISLSTTEVAVKVNKATFDKAGIEYNEMSDVIPLLVDHATKKNNYGVLINKCVGVEFDS